MPSGEKGFKKGHQKSGGRQKGTVNKKTEQWEQIVEFLMTEGVEKYIIEMRKLKGFQYVTSFHTILEYYKPKLSRTTTDIKGDIENTIKVEFV